MTDTNTHGDKFFVEVYYTNNKSKMLDFEFRNLLKLLECSFKKGILCPAVLEQSVRNQNIVFSRSDAHNLAVLLLDEMYNNGKMIRPKRYFDTKFECNYIFEYNLIG